jgi:3-deoxy-7-phosphoheptulonate synthase
MKDTGVCFTPVVKPSNPKLKQRTHLPVIADPSHGTGYRDLVPTMSKAAVAAGADGLLMEFHSHPENAQCDGPQSLFPEDFELMMNDLRKVAEEVGRSIHHPE